MSEKRGLKYVLATKDDYDDVLNFLTLHYYTAEPITIAYIYGKEPTADDVAFSMSFLPQGTIIKVIDPKTNKIVGVSAAGPIFPGDPEIMLKEAETADTRKWSDILKLLAHLEKSADVCRKFNVSKCYHVHIIAVDAAYRGKYIGFNLMKEQLELAQKLGFKLVSVDCTSAFTAKIAEKLGMEFVSELKLEDYKNEEGIQLFVPPEPHKVTKTFISKL